MKIAVVAADGRVAKKVIAEALQRGHEVVAFGRHDINETPAKTYIKKDILSGTNVRLLIVGGAGSLYVDPDHTTQLVNTPDFPDAFKPLANAMGKALAELRQRNDVKWTYISPAADFQADGQRTGKYLLAGEEFTLNSKQESIISYADYAIAMVDEIEKGQHIKQRISVVRD